MNTLESYQDNQKLKDLGPGEQRSSEIYEVILRVTLFWVFFNLYTEGEAQVSGREILLRGTETITTFGNFTGQETNWSLELQTDGM